MSDDITRALRRQIAQLQATQTYLRVAASKALPFPNVWRAEARAEQKCHELLQGLGIEMGRLKRGPGAGSQSTSVRPDRTRRTNAPAGRASSAPAGRREPPPAGRAAARRSSGLVSFDDAPNDSKPNFLSYDDEDEDLTVIGAQPVRAAARSTGSAPTRRSGPTTSTRNRPVPPSRRATPSQPLARAGSGPQSRWGRGPDARTPSLSGRLTIDEGPPAIGEDLGVFDPDEEKLFGDDSATVVGDPREATPNSTRRQTPTPAPPPPPPSPARVTSGLYGGASVPTVRGSSTRPRAAAVQLNTSGVGGRVVGLDDDVEPIEIGAAEDDDEFVEHAGGGFSVTLQEQDYEAEAAYVEDEEDLELLSELQDLPDEEPEADPGASPEEVASLVLEARNALSGGDLAAAADLFSDVIDADPDHVEAHVSRGRVFLDLGDYSRAMSDFMVAEEIAQDNPEPQVAIGDLYFARKDYRRAIEYFNAALEMDPEHAMAFCRRGISHYYRKNYNDALEDLLHAQQLRPDIPNLTTYVAMAQKKKQRKKRP
ncbi:MAG: tetratricopeptide repeat protein [Myxococcota bacterium]